MAQLYHNNRKEFFFNTCNLKFLNNTIEKDYQNDVKKSFMSRALIFSVFSLIYEVLIFVVNDHIKNVIFSIDTSNFSKIELEKYNITQSNCYKLEKFTFVILGISIFNFIINMIGIKKRSLMTFLSFITVLCFGLQSVNLREALYLLYKNTFGINSSIEVLFYFLYLTTIDCNYIVIILGSFLTLICSWIIGIILKVVPIIEIVVNTVAIFILLIFSYYMEKRKKSLFFYKWEKSKTNEWLKNILNNFQNGLIVMDKTQILYFNEYVNKNLDFLLERQDTIVNSDFFITKDQINTNESKLKYINVKNCTSSNNSCYQGENNQTINHFISINENNFKDQNKSLQLNPKLFKNLENINPNLPEEVSEILKKENTSLADIITAFENENNKSKSFENFILIGTKKFHDKKNEDQITILEIFLRIIEDENDNIKFEILLNDVSRMILIEETKAQMKYKTLFLAKVAHEFKNPLIIIQEIIDQTLEELPKNFILENANTVENLAFTKNLSSYLLILVKDFEVISKRENATKIDINPSYFNIREELNYLNQIVQALIIKKYGGKELSPIYFEMKIFDEIPQEIYTDRMRLSQILINLLSNSIKFTHSGKISLIVEREFNKLRFSVKDEGVGIEESKVKNLFKNFQKSNDINNSYGSGLGLGIAKELSSLLGGSIRYENNKPRGSIFSFIINYEENCSDYSSPNQKAHNGISKEVVDANLNFIISYKTKSDVNILSSKIFSRIFKEIDILSPMKYNEGICCKNYKFSVDSECLQNKLKYKNLISPDEKNKIESSTQIGSARPRAKFEEPKIDINRKDSLITISKNCSGDVNPTIVIENYKNSMSNAFHCFVDEDLCKNFSLKKTFKTFKKKVKSDRSTNRKRSRVSSIENVNEAEFKNEYKYLGPSNKINLTKKLCIIIADDENFIRKSAIRQFDKFFDSIDLQFDLELTIIETTDGIECLYAIYQCVIQNIQIDVIITDETMKYMSGSMLYEVVSKIEFGENIPVSIVTAYEDQSKFSRSNGCGIFSKPLNFKIIEQILCISKITF